MPITEDDIRSPKFVKLKTKYPYSENRKDKFFDLTYDNIRRYRADSYPQSGYNPESNTITVKKQNLYSEDLIIPFK